MLGRRRFCPAFFLKKLFFAPQEQGESWDRRENKMDGERLGAFGLR